VNEKKTSKFSYLKEIDLKNQTVFQQAELHFTTGLNVIIGENGTGKSHLLKLAYSILAWIGACQSTYKKGFPCPFCSLTTAPGCNALAALRPLSSFTKERSYLNGSTPSGTFQKKCPGYQRLLVTAYRLP
jgi:hypothetical protein